LTAAQTDKGFLSSKTCFDCRSDRQVLSKLNYPKAFCTSAFVYKLNYPKAFCTSAFLQAQLPKSILRIAVAFVYKTEQSKETIIEEVIIRLSEAKPDKPAQDQH
jgi:hypothetical protein